MEAITKFKRFKKIKGTPKSSRSKRGEPTELEKVNEAILQERSEMKQNKYNYINTINQLVREYEYERDTEFYSIKPKIEIQRSKDSNPKLAKIYIIFKELVKQITVHCKEHGLLLVKIWNNYFKGKV